MERLLFQVADVDPGEVKAAFRRIMDDGKSGIIQYGYKFHSVVEWRASLIN